jgi:hypothetical protein
MRKIRDHMEQDPVLEANHINRSYTQNSTADGTTRPLLRFTILAEREGDK